jgi:hypothetical protein
MFFRYCITLVSLISINLALIQPDFAVISAMLEFFQDFQDFRIFRVYCSRWIASSNKFQEKSLDLAIQAEQWVIKI